MASFSSSEISSMISSKKYRIKRGDTLSGLADKFQGSFSSAKCMNKSSLMDTIYNMNKSSFGGKKEIIIEGKDLDLKFMCDCRCHLKIDKSKKEYLFTDEDRFSSLLSDIPKYIAGLVISGSLFQKNIYKIFKGEEIEKELSVLAMDLDVIQPVK